MWQQNFPLFHLFLGAGTSRKAKGGLVETAAGPSCVFSQTCFLRIPPISS
jgi:hypothetical protein